MATIPPLSAGTYYAVVKAVWGNSRFTVYVPAESCDVSASLKKTAKSTYRGGAKRLVVNSVVILKYDRDYDKGFVLKKCDTALAEAVVAYYKVPVFDDNV